MNRNSIIATGEDRANRVIDAIRKENKDLFPHERGRKFCSMASSPLVFYRGTNHLYWADITRLDQGDPLSTFGNAETRTWIQGDLHAYNYGSFRNAEGATVYDLNDFDEAIYADYQYDVWRMAISIVLVARKNKDLPKSQLQKVVDAFAYTYLDTLDSLEREKKKNAKKFYMHPGNTFGHLRLFLKSVERHYTRAGESDAKSILYKKGMLNKWTLIDDGISDFNIEKSKGKLDRVNSDERDIIERAMAVYRDTLKDRTLAEKDRYFKVKDVALRLRAGIGSLGTPRFYVLIRGDNADNQEHYRILDVKRQSKPAAYQYLDEETRNNYEEDYEGNHALRHAKAYRKLTYRADRFLGWMHLESPTVGDGENERDASGYYSVRERSPFKEAFPCEVLDTRTAFSEMVEQWAEVIATDHARANQDLPKHVLEQTDREKDFVQHVRSIAFNYADQVQADWEIFKGLRELRSYECKQLAFEPPRHRGMLPR